MFKKILIVDDEETSRRILAIALEGKENRLIFAKDGEEAVALARAEAPNLIVMDIDLPKMNGYEAAEKIRQIPAWRRPDRRGHGADGEVLRGDGPAGRVRRLRDEALPARRHPRAPGEVPVGGSRPPPAGLHRRPSRNGEGAETGTDARSLTKRMPRRAGARRRPDAAG